MHLDPILSNISQIDTSRRHPPSCMACIVPLQYPTPFSEPSAALLAQINVFLLPRSQRSTVSHGLDHESQLKYRSHLTPLSLSRQARQPLQHLMVDRPRNIIADLPRYCLRNHRADED